METQVNQVGTTYESILAQSSKENKSIRKISRTYPAYISLIILLALSFFIYNIVDQRVKSDRKVTFDKAVTSVMTRFESNYRTHLQVLQSMRGLYDNLVQVVRDYFMLYASIPTKTYPSVISLMSVQKVEPAALGEYIHYVRSQGYYDYLIHPAGNRDVYYPCEFVVPETTNVEFQGKDFGLDNNFMDALKRSAEKSTTTSTDVYKLRGDTLEFILVSAVFKKDLPIKTPEERLKNLESAVTLEINAPVFLERALGHGITSDSSIMFECVQRDSDNHETEILSSFNYKAGTKAAFQDEQVLKIADKKIIVKFATIPDFGGSFQNFLPMLSLIISMVLSFAFFGFVLSVTTGRARAQDLAERMTRSQRRIVSSSKDIIAVMDLVGEWKSMNPASLEIFEYEPESLIGVKIDGLFVHETDLKHFYSFLEQAADETSKRVDYQMKTQDGNMKWISWNFNVSKSDKLVYCIGRDITLEKLAEEEDKLKSKQIFLSEHLTQEASEFKSYFMTKLSHQLRNSLTSIIGFHQLLTQKKYKSEAEHDSYLEMAQESSEELFSDVTDMVDVALGEGANSSKDLSTVSLLKIVDKAKQSLTSELEEGQNVEVEFIEKSGDAVVLADVNLLSDSMKIILKALSETSPDTKIEVNAQENHYEGNTEIQITTSPNPLVAEMVDVYKKNYKNMVDALRFDKNDIVLNFAIASSNLRLMNGTMSVETFGADEGNVVQITLPLQKQVLN